MNKLKRKAVYEAPLTEFFQVELEGVFCGSVGLENPGQEKDQAGILDQQINTGFSSDNFTGTPNSGYNGWTTFED